MSEKWLLPITSCKVWFVHLFLMDMAWVFLDIWKGINCMKLYLGYGHFKFFSVRFGCGFLILDLLNGCGGVLPIGKNNLFWKSEIHSRDWFDKENFKFFFWILYLKTKKILLLRSFLKLNTKKREYYKLQNSSSQSQRDWKRVGYCWRRSSGVGSAG